MITQSVLNLLKKESAFFNSPIHGFKHWQTVGRNAHYLANFNSADTEVLSYFAYFLTVCEKMRSGIKVMAPRAASFAKKHRDLIPLNDIQFKQLTDACKGHTNGERPECVTINTCWDSDRLDLIRVGIMPDADRLYNKEAKRIADEGNFLVLGGFGNSIQDKSIFNKITSIFKC